MITKNRLLVILAVGLSAVAFASQASAQPDTQRTPPNPTKISAHREAALRKCTDGIKFESDRYVECMRAEGEEP
jgi:hypothetical protein